MRSAIPLKKVIDYTPESSSVPFFVQIFTCSALILLSPIERDVFAHHFEPICAFFRDKRKAPGTFVILSGSSVPENPAAFGVNP